MQPWESAYAPVTEGILNQHACEYNNMFAVLSCEYHPAHGQHLVLEVDYSNSSKTSVEGLTLLKAITNAMKDKGYSPINTFLKPAMDEDPSVWYQRLTLASSTSPRSKVEADFHQAFKEAVTLLNRNPASELLNTIGRALDPFEGKPMTSELRAFISIAIIRSIKEMNSSQMTLINRKVISADLSTVHQTVREILRKVTAPVFTEDLKNSVTAQIVRGIMQPGTHQQTRH